MMDIWNRAGVACLDADYKEIKMGEAGNMLTETMERGSSWVYDKKEKKKFVVDNTELMYGTWYDSERYIVLGDCEE
jgi:hypothetical protein